MTQEICWKRTIWGYSFSAVISYLIAEGRKVYNLSHKIEKQMGSNFQKSYLILKTIFLFIFLVYIVNKSIIIKHKHYAARYGITVSDLAVSDSQYFSTFISCTDLTIAPCSISLSPSKKCWERILSLIICKLSHLPKSGNGTSQERHVISRTIGFASQRLE